MVQYTIKLNTLKKLSLVVVVTGIGGGGNLVTSLRIGLLRGTLLGAPTLWAYMSLFSQMYISILLKKAK